MEGRASGTSGARSARPSAWRQLGVLVRKQLQVDRKGLAGALVRIVIGPLLVLAFFGAQQQQQAASAQAQPVGALSTFPAQGASAALGNTAAFSLYLHSPPTLAAQLEQVRAAVARDARFAGSVTVVPAPDLAAFTAACQAALANPAAAGACVELSAAPPAPGAPGNWSLSVLVGGSRMSSALPSGEPPLVIAAAQRQQAWGELLSSGALLAQDAVSSAILQLRNASLSTGSLLGGDAWLQQQPLLTLVASYPSWSLLLVAGLDVTLGLFMQLGFILTPPLYEIKLGVERQFVLMGVPRAVWWMHWMVVFSLYGLLSALVWAAVVIYFRFCYLANFFLVFTSFAAAGWGLAAMAVVLPRVVASPDAAQLMPFLLWIGSVAIYVVVLLPGDGQQPNLAGAVPLILTVLNPFWGVMQFMAIYYAYDATGLAVGVQFSNWWASGVGPCFCAQLGQVALYVWLVFRLNRAPRRTKRSAEATAAAAAASAAARSAATRSAEACAIPKLVGPQTRTRYVRTTKRRLLHGESR